MQLRTWLVMGVMMVGCAGKGATSASSPPSATNSAEANPTETTARSEGQAIPPAAAQLYMLGEERYAQGRFDEAVALWGHTMLQLPADPSADTVRHKLIARMGYGLLQAHHATGDLSYLVDGQTLCELYIAKHEALFGDGDEPRAQRGEIYELLYEFDARLDGTEHELLDEEPTTLAAATEPAEVEPESRGHVEVEGEGDEVDGEGDDVRIVTVRRIAWADADDPRVRGFLTDRRFTGPSSLDLDREYVHEHRVLVRVGERPRTLAKDASADTRKAARAAGTAVVDAARPGLQECYELAMTREPIFAARLEVTLRVDPKGAVSQLAAIEGAVIDDEGSTCALRALAQAEVEPPATGKAVTVSMPIHFFYQQATNVAELIRVENPGSLKAYERTGRVSGLPPIDAFSILMEPYVVPNRVKRTIGVSHLDPSQQDLQRFPTE